MALSGSFDTSAAPYYGGYYTFNWSATQNVAKNQSTVS